MTKQIGKPISRGEALQISRSIIDRAEKERKQLYERVEVFIPMAIRSQNQFTYHHWRKYSGYAAQWKKAIGFLLGRGEHGRQKKHVQIISIRKRFLDEGNLIGGAKPIPDALKKFGWIVDDSPRWVEISYRQIKSKIQSEFGTVIIVEEG